MEIIKGQKYIVRCDRSGVFYGEIVSKNGREMELANARNIHYWDGACSLLQLSADGTSKPKECRLTVAVDSLVVLDVIEIIPCTQKAVKSLESVIVWKI